MTRDVESLLGAYALDAVDDAERAEVEQLLREYPHHQAEVDSLREAASALTASAAVAPPASLRDRILADAAATPAPNAGLDTPQEPIGHSADRPAPQTVADTNQLQPPRDELAARRRSRLGRWGAGLAAAAAVALVAVVWSPWNDQQPGGPNNPGQVNQPGSEQLAMQVVNAPDAKKYQFELDAKPATVTRSASLDRAVLTFDASMPPAPSGKAYQMWWKTAQGTFVSAGMVPADKSGPVLMSGAATTAVGVGVTVEPPAGSQQPTTTPLGLVELT